MFACRLFQNSKVRRFAFELKMQDKSTFLLAADSEAEMEEWIGTLNKILHSSFEQAMQEKRNGDLHDGVSPPVFFFDSVHQIKSFVCIGSCTSRHSRMLTAPAGFAETEANTSLCCNTITLANRAHGNLSNRWRTWKNRPLVWNFSRQLSGCLLFSFLLCCNMWDPSLTTQQTAYKG